jgi:hypothetical protein
MLAVVEDGDAVRQRHRFGLVMGDEDHRHAQLRCSRRISSCISSRSFLSSAESGSSISTTTRIEDQRAGQRHPLLLAAGQLRRPAVGQVPRAHRVQRTRPPGWRSGAGTLRTQRKGHVLGHGHVREQRIALEHHAHAALVRRKALDRPAVQDGSCPPVGFSKPASSISVVVLPEPDGPSSVMNSPASMSSVQVIDRGHAAAAGVDLAAG